VDANPEAGTKARHSPHELHLSTSVASKKSAAPLAHVDLGSLFHLVGGANLVLAHEVGIIGHHLLFELSKSILSIIVGIFRDLVLLHFVDIVNLLQHRVRITVDHMDSVVILRPVVLQCLFITDHLNHEWSVRILKLEGHILSRSAKSGLQLFFDLNEWLAPVESDLLESKVGKHGVGDI